MAELTAGLPDGPHPVRVSMVLIVSAGWRDSSVGHSLVETAGTLTVVPEASRSIRLVKDPGLREALKKSIKANFAKPPNWMTGQPFFLRLVVEKPPIALAGNVVMRAGGGEWPGQEFLATKKGNAGGFELWQDLKKFRPEQVSVVFRPDPQVAAVETEVEEVWGEELELVPEGSALGPKDPW
jgi:hypothetical protein